MRRTSLTPALAPFLLSAATALVCFRAAGPSAGTFFGGLAFAVLIVPPFVAAERTWRLRFLVGGAAVAGTSLVWLYATRDPYVTIRHWLSAVAVLAALSAALGGTAVALRAGRLPLSLAAALTTLLFFLWLSWPIWLSPHAAGRERLVGALTVAHPVLALDGSLTALGPPWTERPMMYNELSVLNQDVGYALPRTVLWSALLHLAIGVTGVLVASRLMTREPAVVAATA
jgi:hypothetical protein